MLAAMLVMILLTKDVLFDVGLRMRRIGSLFGAFIFNLGGDDDHHHNINIYSLIQRKSD